MTIKIEPQLPSPVTCETPATWVHFSEERKAKPAWGPGVLAPHFAEDYGRILADEMEGDMLKAYYDWRQAHKCAPPCTRELLMIGPPYTTIVVRPVTSPDGKHGFEATVRADLYVKIACKKPRAET